MRVAGMDHALENPRRALRLGSLVIFLSHPTGDSANEIFGRISNTGYYMALLTPVALLARQRYTGMKKHAIDAGIVIAAGTNPLVFAIAPVSLILLQPRNGFRAYAVSFARDNVVLLSGLTAVMLLIASRATGEPGEMAGVTLNANALVEVALARGILYLFVFPLYPRLTDILACVIFLAFLAAWIHAWRFTDRATRKTALFLAANAVAVLVLTLILRPTLSHQLGGYATTFPDRYFICADALFLLATVCLLFGRYKTDSSARKVATFGAIFLAITYAVQLPWLVEWSSPRMSLGQDTFADRVCLHGTPDNRSARTAYIPVHFDGWVMRLPDEVLARELVDLDCTTAWQRFFLTDPNWSEGISGNFMSYLLPASEQRSINLRPGTLIELLNGERREIVNTEVNGGYIRVYVDAPMPPRPVSGYPSQFRIVMAAAP